jgi:hypothetical protein
MVTSHWNCPAQSNLMTTPSLDTPATPLSRLHFLPLAVAADRRKWSLLTGRAASRRTRTLQPCLASVSYSHLPPLARCGDAHRRAAESTLRLRIHFCTASGSPYSLWSLACSHSRSSRSCRKLHEPLGRCTEPEPPGISHSERRQRRWPFTPPPRSRRRSPPESAELLKHS